MEKLLYVTANPKGIEKSKGLQIGETFLETFQSERPDVLITRLDLFNASIPIPAMDADLVSARGKVGGYGIPIDQLEGAERSKLAAMHSLAEEFKGYDYYVFVSPVWNLGSPAVLKAFLDNLFVHGKTFQFTAEGPKGMLSGKKGIHIQTRGGIYSCGPMKELESGDRYLQIAMNFLGISMMDTVFAEGLDHFPNQINEIVSAAKEKAAYAAREMAKCTVEA
jgi:FMN-dependent NADH-azoreductase